MDTTLISLCLLTFFALYVWIGWRASKGQKSSDDYFLMGRQLTFFPLCMTLLATQVGGGSFIGAAEEAYCCGWGVMIYPLGSALGLSLLGMGFGAKLREMDISTTAEVFEKTYSSPLLRQVASLLSIVSLYAALVGQGIAARKLLFSLGIEADYLFILFWIAFVAYTTMGGLKAVVETDLLQALLILAAVAVLALSIDLFSPAHFSADDALMGSGSPFSFLKISWFLMPLLFMLVEQDMGQRCFAAKRSRAIAPAAVCASLLIFACGALAVSMGVLARGMDLAPGNGATVLVTAVSALATPWVSTFFIAAIFMAIASTADSLLCSIGSNITYDFLLRNKRLQRGGVAQSRWTTLLTGLSALILVYLLDNVLNALIMGYALCVSTLLVPVVAAALSSRPSRSGAILALISGGTAFLIVQAVELSLSGDGVPLIDLLPLAISTLGYLLGAKCFAKLPAKESKGISPMEVQVG